MRVTATHPGFFVKLRTPGEEFDIPESRFSEKWMKRVEDASEAEPEAAEVVAVEPSPALSQESAAPATETVVKKRRGRKPKAVSE